jgi:hypothetical protein
LEQISVDQLLFAPSGLTQRGRGDPVDLSQ